MAEAGVERCPVCGAPVKVGATACDFCSSELLTVRCAGCFVLNAAQGLRCSGCGRELGLEPLSLPSELTCPDCAQLLTGYSGSSGLLAECGACRGQFVEHALLKDLLERREVYHGHGPEPPRANPLDRPVRYLPCPSCKTVMNRKNFGDSSGIVVDVCARHGMWFDHGELPRVLAFVEAGGLERARRRRVEDGERRARAIRVEQSASRPLVVQEERRDWAALGQAGLDLIELVVFSLKS
jgi:Zn-finger nucleic acid-binding protein